MTNYQEEIQALTVCRDYWNTSFENERANVIRLRGIVARMHAMCRESLNFLMPCMCEDCKIVRAHNSEPKIPLAVPPETAP